MNFSKMVPYSITKPLAIADAYLEYKAFTPCHGTQQSSSGFSIVPGTDKYLHIGDDFMYMLYTEESRILPGSVVKDALEERIEEFENREGYTPARAVRRQMKDDVTAALLPKAFTKQDKVGIMVIPSKALLLCFGTAKLADNATAELRDALDSLPIASITPKLPMDKTMADWIAEDSMPEIFSAGSKAILMDKDKAKISTDNQDLMTDEVKTIIDSGKTVHMIELNYEPTVKFKINEHFQFLYLKYIGEVTQDEIEDESARLNHTLGVASVWIKDLIEQLVLAFGGFQDEIAIQMKDSADGMRNLDQDTIEENARIDIEARIAKAKEEHEKIMEDTEIDNELAEAVILATESAAIA